MPFRSEKQRRYLWATHPEIAKRWAHKYPESNKGLPMYADDKDDKNPSATTDKHSSADFQAFLARLGADRTKTINSILDENPGENCKKADSKQERVTIPHSEGPVYAGEERAEGKIEQATPGEPVVNDSKPENTINSLLQKISVVLSPSMAQEMERRKALAEGRQPGYQPKNVNLKQYPVQSAVTPPPMGMTAPPQQPQQPAQAPQPAQPANTGMNSPSARPIQSFGGLSTSGNINGNAAFGAKNSPDSMKISAAIEKWAAGNPTLAWLNSMEFPLHPEPEDFAVLDDESDGLRAKTAATPAWQRAAGKNDEGGLNAKGRASYNRATGGNLKAPVTEKNPKGKRAKRQNSFCSRMCGMKKHETGSKTKKDPDSRINKALRKWNCKCSSAYEFGQKIAQDFDPTLSRDAENAIMHGTGLVGSGAMGMLAGLPISYGLDAIAQRNNWVPDSSAHPYGHAAVNSLLNIPILAGGMLGTRLYDNYILRPHMKREHERKQQEEAVRQQLAQQAPVKQAEASLGRILGTALASTGGGLLLGGYPGWKLQQASENAGNHEFTNFVAGKAPIALAGALSAGLYNHLYDQYEKKQPKKKKPAPVDPAMKYLQYVVH